MSRPAPPFEVQDRPLLGVMLMIAAMSIVPLMDGVAKFMTTRYPVEQVVWARFFFHLLALLPVLLWRLGPRSLLPARPLVQVLRGGLLLCATLLFFSAIATMPLADALALLFVAPLVVTALSPLVLGERVGVHRWSAVIVGFIGALIVIRPGFGTVQVGALLAFGAGCAHGCYLLATRKLAGSSPPLLTLAYTAVFGVVAMSLWMPFVWTPPGLVDWGYFLLMGIFAASGHFLLIKAFDQAPASVLAPYGYTEIIMATAIGFVIFGDFPDAWTWSGIGVIVASGIYISIRERLRRRRPRPGG